MGEFLSTMRRAITFGAEFPRLPGEREEEGLRRKVESSYRPPLLPCPSSSSSSDRKPTTRNLFTLRCFPSPFPGGRPHCATGGKRAKGLDIKQGLHAEFEPENCFALLTLGIGILYTQYYPFPIPHCRSRSTPWTTTTTFRSSLTASARPPTLTCSWPPTASRISWPRAGPRGSSP